MAPSHPVSRAGLAAVDKVTKKADSRSVFSNRQVLKLTVEGTDQMTNLADKMLRCGTLQVGLHMELDLTNGSISTRDDVTPAALMRAMGYMPVAEEPRAREYLAAALVHLRKMSDPLPLQLREAVTVNIDANSTPDDVCHDAVTALMSSISTLHAHTTVATNIGYKCLGTLDTDAGKLAPKLLNDLLDPINKTFGWRMLYDRMKVILGNPWYLYDLNTLNERQRTECLTETFAHMLSVERYRQSELTATDVMLHIARDMARINFFTRVVGHSLMIAFGRLDPNSPDTAVQWQGTDIASIARSYKNFELLEQRMIGYFRRRIDSPVVYNISGQCLADPVLQMLLEPTLKDLQQQPGLEHFKLEHVLDPANDHFHSQFTPSD